MTPLASKSPLQYDGLFVNRLAAQMLKSRKSTTPLRLASPSKYGFPDGRFTDQVTENPACCQLAFEFKTLYQAINRKLILERAYGTEVRRRFAYTDTADGIPGRAQRKSASEAM